MTSAAFSSRTEQRPKHTIPCSRRATSRLCMVGTMSSCMSPSSDVSSCNEHAIRSSIDCTISKRRASRAALFAASSGVVSGLSACTRWCHESAWRTEASGSSISSSRDCTSSTTICKKSRCPLESRRSTSRHRGTSSAGSHAFPSISRTSMYIFWRPISSP